MTATIPFWASLALGLSLLWCALMAIFVALYNSGEFWPLSSSAMESSAWGLALVFAIAAGVLLLW